VVVRVFFGVEVVEIPKEFIEAMSARWKLIAVAMMVLAKLPGGITQRLENLCDVGARGPWTTGVSPAEAVTACVLMGEMIGVS